MPKSLTDAAELVRHYLGSVIPPHWGAWVAGGATAVFSWAFPHPALFGLFLAMTFAPVLDQASVWAKVKVKTLKGEETEEWRSAKIARTIMKIVVYWLALTLVGVAGYSVEVLSVVPGVDQKAVASLTGYSRLFLVLVVIVQALYRELVSVSENLAEAGYPLPKAVRDLLRRGKRLGD